MKRRCHNGSAFCVLYYFYKIREDIDGCGNLGCAAGIYRTVYIFPFAVRQAKGSFLCAFFNNRCHKDIIAQHEAVGYLFKALVREYIF